MTKIVAPIKKPGSIAFADKSEHARNEVHLGPLRSTPLGLVLLLFLVIALVSIFYSFFTGQVAALIFWVIVEAAAGGAFLWDRNTNLPKQPQA